MLTQTMATLIVGGCELYVELLSSCESQQKLNIPYFGEYGHSVVNHDHHHDIEISGMAFVVGSIRKNVGMGVNIRKDAPDNTRVSHHHQSSYHHHHHRCQ